MARAVVGERRNVAPAALLAKRQRVWKRQPGGGSIALGMSPSSSARSRTAVGSGSGTADSSARV